MNISLHNTQKITASKVRKQTTPEDDVYFVKRFEFVDDKGNAVTLTAFANNEQSLKIK